MVKKIILWTAVLCLSIQIFGFSSATAKKSGGTSKKISTVVFEVVQKVHPVAPQKREAAYFLCDKIVRKMAHFSEYLLLAVLTLCLARSYQLKLKTSAVISGAYCLFYAITDEVHQLFVPGRSGEVLDVCIDFSGALTGILLSCLAICLYRRRKIL